MSEGPPEAIPPLEENRALRTKVAELSDENKSLQQQLDWFKRQLFGRKSEKCAFENPEQIQLGLGEDADAACPEEELEDISYRRRKKQRGNSVTDSGLRFDENVPVQVIQIPAPELEGLSEDEYELIGEKVTHRLAQRIGSYVVLEYRRPVAKLLETERICAAPAPPAIFDRTMADVSFLAGLLADKFSYHLPLYRQHLRLADAGIRLSRATLTHYAQRSIDLLEPIYDAQLRHILMSRVLAVDETPIKAGRKRKKKPKKPGQMRSAWFWPIYGEEHEVCFSWAETRGAEHLENVLKGFRGILLSDGYQAYDSYAEAKSEVVQAQCWSHTRRYFERAKDGDPAAMTALQKIASIYRIETEIRMRDLNGDWKLRHRGTHAKPLVEDFLKWCRNERLRSDLVDSDLLTKALKYAINHEAELQVYLGDPGVPIDTNHLERTLRVIPMGRKNWLFCWTEVGARHVGIIQSLLTTCRLHGVDPCTYLVDVLQRVSTQPSDQVHDLTPRRWKELFAGDPLRSDLESAGASDAVV